jgi:hypothetical protein
MNEFGEKANGHRAYRVSNRGYACEVRAPKTANKESPDQSSHGEAPRAYNLIETKRLQR